MVTLTCFFLVTALVTSDFAVDHVRSFAWCVPTTNETAGNINPLDSPWPGVLNGALDSILCSAGQQSCHLLNTPPWHWVLKCMGALLVLHFAVPPQAPPPPQPIQARDNVLRNLFVGVNGNFIANMRHVPQVGLNIGHVQPEN